MSLTLRLVSLLMLLALSGLPARAETLSERLRDALENGTITVNGDGLLAEQAVLQFYERRGFQPAWTKDRRALPRAHSALKSISDAARHGLNPDHYHRAELQGQLAAAEKEKLSRRAQIELDAALTDAVLTLGAHYLAGRLDPKTIDPQWSILRRSRDLPALLENALEIGDPAALLDSLLPPQRQYWQLVNALAEIRAIMKAGGLPRVSGGPLLRPGMRDSRVPVLRRYLSLTADYMADDLDDPAYDAPLVAAVKHFQSRHGLEPDGLVGPATLRALNFSAEDRARRIAVNLERWRWLPQDLGRRHVLVNIAGFWVEAVENGEIRVRKRAIVGREYRQTPVFSDEITYIVVNPSWTVPPKLAVEDKLPLIQENPDYLPTNNYRVYQGWNEERKEIDPLTVDWTRLNRANFPYTLVQQPGPDNALGRVKIMFPNEFSVYLHDTPSQDLFTRARRTFSSGCIRVEDAMELADWLLNGERGGGIDLENAAADGQERTIRLREAVPVHLLYWTAWVDDSGGLNLVEDIYHRDARVAAALQQPPPETGP